MRPGPSAARRFRLQPSETPAISKPEILIFLTFKADAIGTLINKFLDPDIDLSPGGIDNHSMGTVFEELVRKFNEENNEDAVAGALNALRSYHQV
jgi:hypothetical protein